jgi:hypothetical protein
MEIQVIFQSVKGVMKNQAVLSFLFENYPGKSNNAIS